jgi:hypothetical protein
VRLSVATNVRMPLRSAWSRGHSRATRRPRRSMPAKDDHAALAAVRDQPNVVEQASRCRDALRSRTRARVACRAHAARRHARRRVARSLATRCGVGTRSARRCARREDVRVRRPARDGVATSGSGTGIGSTTGAAVRDGLARGRCAARRHGNRDRHHGGWCHRQRCRHALGHAPIAFETRRTLM